MTEQILVIPRSDLGDFLNFRGFRSIEHQPNNNWLQQCSFKDRPPMEQDPSYKQLIPYIILRQEDRVFRYWRTKKAGESRLHHLYSIGIGGHINPQDDNLFSQGCVVIEEAAQRELKEEVRISGLDEFRQIGWINDDESEVGRVHLGLAYEAWLTSSEVSLNEQALGRGEWKPIDELMDGVEYETWSLFLIEEYLLHGPKE